MSVECTPQEFIGGYLNGYFFDCEETERAEQAALDLLSAMKISGYAVVDAERYRVALKAFTDLTEAWAELRMDTEKDQALHDRLVAASRIGATLLEVQP